MAIECAPPSTLASKPMAIELLLLKSAVGTTLDLPPMAIEKLPSALEL